MTNRHDDIPPPPYSETDIYSTSGGDRSPAIPSSPSHHRRGSYNRDNISRSPTSTVDGEVIYTPPLTPRTGSQPSISGSNLNYAGSNSNSFSNYVAPTPNTSSVIGDHLTTASAQAYFDTRPAPPARAVSNVVCNITVRDDSSPDSFPFPADLFQEKDITAQDWQTFVNYLIPFFHAENNERVIDRKLRAEGITPPAAENNYNSNRNEDALSGNRSTTHAEAEAQLGQIRSPLVGSFPTTQGGGRLSDSRRQVVEQTVREWNDGFFGPRGVIIRANTSAEDVLNVAPMPGGWDASFDTTNPNTAGAETSANAGPSGTANNSTRSRFARFMPQFGGGPHSFGLGIAPSFGPGGGGPGNTFRLGGIAVDGDRLSIGDRFVADRNGLRIGSFVADNNGISVNGQPMFGGCPPAGAGPGPDPRMRGMPGWGAGGFGGGPRGGCRDGPGGGGPWVRGWGGPRRGHGWGGRHGHGHGFWSGFGPGPAPGADEDHHHHDDHDHDHGHGHRGRRGRRGERQGRHRSRSRSADSVSSVSSSSSSSSESSIGSLPDYDELRDSQLFVARDQLLAWLHDPEQPITKEKLKEFKQKVKEAKNAPKNNASGINEPVKLRHDQKALSKEVKALMKEWKDLKKQQTKLRRQLRRERKQQRRAEKRERRNTKRELKRAAKEQKRAARRNGGCSSSSSLPDVDPRVAGMPGAFSPPNVPPMPGVPPQNTWPFNNHGGGPFGPGPNAPPGIGSIFSPFNIFGGGNGRQPQPSEGTTNRDAQAPAPGAWPSNDEPNSANSSAHVASQAKYKVANDLEAKLIEKETELFKLHKAIALAADAEAGSSSRGGSTTSSDARAKNEKQMLAVRDLEAEIEDLAKQMALMRTEADAEYAKELARMA